MRRYQSINWSRLLGNIQFQEYFLTPSQFPNSYNPWQSSRHDDPALKCGVFLISEDIFSSSYAEELPICEGRHFL
jgi:hypothetical protein